VRFKRANKQAEKSDLSKGERFCRRLRWIFLKSGIISLAFEHFLAMIPATILVPVLVNNAHGAIVIDMSLVLFTSGVGTIAFTVLTKGKIPAYLSSSFAYIGLTVYLIKEFTVEGASHEMAFAYVGWAYILSGVTLYLLSKLYLKKGIERFLSFIMPATVIGPAISLIGLELADTAVVDSGFDLEDGLVDGNAAIVAMCTLAVIILFSLFRHKFFKNAAIIVGMVVGCAVSFAINGVPTDYFADATWVTYPKITFPTSLPDFKTLAGLFVAVLPATFIVFTENIGRFTVISRMKKDDAEADATLLPKEIDASGEVIDDGTGDNDIFTASSVNEMRDSVKGHGISTLIASVLGSVPNTIYAENIAVMGIHRNDNKRDEPDSFIKKLTSPFSVAPYIIAAVLAMIFAFSGYLQAFLLGIPKAVIGGMELFLFGLISAPGIQLLVEQHVNYKKISNQITTAAVLISGISGLSINFGFVEIKGMGLGFVVGVGINLVMHTIKWFGRLSDVITIDELVLEVLSFFPEDTGYRVLGYKKEGQAEIDYQRNCVIKGVVYALNGRGCSIRLPNGQFVSDDVIRDEIKHAVELNVGIGGAGTSNAVLHFKKTINGLFLDVKADAVPLEVKKAYLNDYEAIDEDGEWLVIKVSDIPMRKIKALVRHVQNGTQKPAELSTD